MRRRVEEGEDLNTLEDYQAAFKEFCQTWHERPGFRHVTNKAIDVLLDHYLEVYLGRHFNEPS